VSDVIGDVGCEYCGGTLIKTAPSMYLCDDCGRGVTAGFVED